MVLARGPAITMAATKGQAVVASTGLKRITGAPLLKLRFQYFLRLPRTDANY
jgi:hypothetical protein